MILNFWCQVFAQKSKMYKFCTNVHHRFLKHKYNWWFICSRTGTDAVSEFRIKRVLRSNSVYRDNTVDLFAFISSSFYILLYTKSWSTRLEWPWDDSWAFGPCRFLFMRPMRVWQSELSADVTLKGFFVWKLPTQRPRRRVWSECMCVTQRLKLNV